MREFLTIYARRAIWNDSVQLAFVEKKSNGMRSVALPLQFKELAPGEEITDPLDILQTEAQRLMDELWNCGLRPSEGAGSAGAMAATEKHLEDMRRLVFKDAAK